MKKKTTNNQIYQSCLSLARDVWLGILLMMQGGKNEEYPAAEACSRNCKPRNAAHLQTY